ncbi:ribosome small subunit-dependent GTPase A [Alcaligenes sp. SDU_A2]|uniref:ribosome small subunit-dependent GTPase A n=1 Tax=Alcaligenes sp. SDU_A2 TaxID=3136634 RepID=UPI002B9604D6|nr:ribosome small subunit-dependent GTPase A [Alcaligenes sp.]HRL27299.1 ribosome small subunit-dependent GTPase A [Alcaligenes sp.]
MTPHSTLSGLVTAAHGRHYFVELPDGRTIKCFPRGKKAGIAVGDQVDVLLQGKDEGAIERVQERRNLLYRSDDFRTKQFAANIDQLLIVVAPEPSYSEDLLGRALVAAWSADIAPVIILNKADLSASLQKARTKLAPTAALGVPILEMVALEPAQTRQILAPWLAGKRTLLLGQSGMGKSTLLNALVPDAHALTREHSQALGTGRHTTTSTRLYHLPEGGDLIDSPGFQAFGLSHLEQEDIAHGFPDFRQAIESCRFYNCSHRHEPGCGVLAGIEAGSIHPDRHALYQRLLAEHENKPRY